MAETVGTLIDKISITELRLWHMREALAGDGLSDERRALCTANLAVITAQRDDLASELDALWARIADGAEPPKVYRQFKLYNDDELRAASQGRVPANSPPITKATGS